MRQPLISNKKEFLSTFLLVSIYALAFLGLQFFLFNTGVVSTLPSAANLVSWDAGWYKSIAQSGYSFSDSGQSSAGFFYLFPAIWGITHLDGFGISFINIFFFAIGFSLLCDLLKPSVSDKMLWLSVPVVFFAFVPYSEALFFLLSALSLIGVVRNIRWLVWISLLLISLTRASVLFLVPAFFFMELIGNDRKNWHKGLLRYLVDYVTPLITGLAIFTWVQYKMTGVWFAYFIAQRKFWDRKYSIPVFPLSATAHFRSLWLGSLAVLACLISLLLLIKMGAQWLAKNKTGDKMLLLAIVYLSMTLFITLFYNPRWSINTTDIVGISRYALINPFFYIFLHHLTKNITYRWPQYLLAFVLANLVWVACGAYVHIQAYLFYTANTIIVFLFMLHANKKLTWPAMILMAIFLIFQVQLFQQFISFSVLPE